MMVIDGKMFYADIVRLFRVFTVEEDRKISYSVTTYHIGDGSVANDSKHLEQIELATLGDAVDWVYNDTKKAYEKELSRN